MISVALRFLVGLLVCGAVHAQTPDLLPASLAFRSEATVVDGQMIDVRFTIADGYYLYRDKLHFSIDGQQERLGKIVLPPGQPKDDENFGRVEVFYQAVSIRLPVERTVTQSTPVTLEIGSQGCAEAGVCYPPQTQRVALTLPAVAEAEIAPPLPPVPSAPPAAPSDADDSGQLAVWLKSASAWMIISAFFGFGLLLSFTPCVFPMIPILLGVIVGSHHSAGGAARRRVFVLSSAYVLGVACAYATLGVVAGMTGTLLSAALQTVWMRGALAGVFVLLALSAFGLFELRLPAALETRLSENSQRLRGRSLLALLAMGALSTLIVSPCIVAPLAGALLYIGQTGDALLGGTALFFLGLGTGVPLLLAGTSAAVLLPKTGRWMVVVRKAFGMVLLAVAIWTMAPMMPVALQLGAWAALLILPAVFLRAIDPLPADAGTAAKLAKGVGLLMLVAGIALLIGAFSGARDPWHPLSALGVGGERRELPSLPFQRVTSLTEIEAAARQSERPLLLDVRAEWCTTCKDMDRLTFADARVRERLEGWLLLQVDVTANSEADQALLKHFRLFGPPAIIFFDRGGNEVKSARVVGFQDADAFLRTLERASPR